MSSDDMCVKFPAVGQIAIEKDGQFHVLDGVRVIDYPSATRTAQAPNAIRSASSTHLAAVYSERGRVLMSSEIPNDPDEWRSYVNQFMAVSANNQRQFLEIAKRLSAENAELTRRIGEMERSEFFRRPVRTYWEEESVDVID